MKLLPFVHLLQHTYVSTLRVDHTYSISFIFYDMKSNNQDGKTTVAHPPTANVNNVSASTWIKNEQTCVNGT